MCVFVVRFEYYDDSLGYWSPIETPMMGESFDEVIAQLNDRYGRNYRRLQCIHTTEY